MTMPVFRIAKVEVEGTRLLSPDLILKMAAIPAGENIFLTRFGRAKKKLLNVSVIKDVKIFRRLPETVIISVKERKEAAMGVLDGQSVLFDDEGVILNPQSNEAMTIEFPDITNLPVISGIKSDWIDSGVRLKGEIGISASKLLSEFKNYIAPHRMEINLTDSDNIGLVFDDTLTVKFGSADNIDLKIKTFEAIYDKLKDKKDSIAYIDVKSPDFPAVKYK